MSLRATRRVHLLREVYALPVLLEELLQVLSLADESLACTRAGWPICDLGPIRAQNFRVFAGNRLLCGLRFNLGSGGTLDLTVPRNFLFGGHIGLAESRLVHGDTRLLVERPGVFLDRLVRGSW